MDRQTQATRGRSVSATNAAHANEFFEHFLNASTQKTILGYYRNICDLLHLRPNVFPLFYPKLRANLTSWRAKALWKKFDLRASHKCYMKGKACPNTRVLIIGGGPCGLRAAIEAQLLGAKVVVVEKRDRMSRNNVLHLWPFVIEDLRMLGAKKFFGKFCAGAIDHISIRQLQCILLKVALLLGVEVHTEVSFEGLIEPNITKKIGWTAEFKPADHPVSQYEFDVIIGADGKRNTLQGFKRKEFRGKLAIAITANFINRRTEAEARVEEISGVAFIFNQKFFKDLYAETGIDLENIVYYKDDTHYFVMTAKKASLIDKGVIKQDLADTEQLLSPDNVDREALMNYAREAADFSTNYQMPNLEFAVNHYGQADVAMFDFTSMYAAENASKVIERNGHRLLMILVGDSLLEPFWPTGSGCARGFLSSMDAAWAIKSWGSETVTPLEVLAERESIYRLLAQTTPDNLNKDWKAYTIDPSTRYPNLNKNIVLPHQVMCLYDTDNPKSIEHMKRPSPDAVVAGGSKRRKKDIVDNDLLLYWVKEQIKEHEDLQIDSIASVFKNGRVLCAIISHYRPDLLEYHSLSPDEPIKNNQTAIDILEKEIGISPLMTGEEMTKTEDLLTMSSYLTEIYHTFRCEIPHINHPKLETNQAISLPSHVPRSEKLILQSTLKPIRPFKKLTESRKTPFDFWLQQHATVDEKNKISETIKVDSKLVNQINSQYVQQNNTLSNCMKQDALNCYIKEVASNSNKDSFKYYDENFMEISPDFASVKSNYDYEYNTPHCSDQLSQLELDLEAFPDIAIDDSNKSVANLLATHWDVQGDSFKQPIDAKPKEFICKAERDYNQINIHFIEQNSYNKQLSQVIKYDPHANCFTVFPTIKSDIADHVVPQSLRNLQHQECMSFPKNRTNCQKAPHVTCLNEKHLKFLCFNNMSETIHDVPPHQIYSRVVDWLSSNDFCQSDVSTKSIAPEIETNIIEGHSDITSVTTRMECADKKKLYDNIVVGKPRSLSKTSTSPLEPSKSTDLKLSHLKKSQTPGLLSKLTNNAHWQILPEREGSNIPETFGELLKSDELELPEPKKTETTFGKPLYPYVYPKKSSTPVQQPSRPSSRHKRHADTTAPCKPFAVSERKPRKRRTLEKIGASVEDRQRRLEDIVSNRVERQNKRRQQRKLQTEQFIKSMQMLQANARTDPSEPFEDYSIFLYRQTAPNFEDRVKDLEKKFTYVPNPENRQPTQSRGEKDEEFAARIKDLEEKWRETAPVEKKPKDLLRAIGKIETSDWNIKEIEKKINENKMGKTVNKDKEKVPKWSREQFLARQTKMEKQHLERQDSKEAKYAHIDKSIKHLEQRLKEGSARDLGQNKVASITEKLIPKSNESPMESKPVQRSNSRVILPTQGASEFCHFCSKRVYLMERLSAEGRFFHHGCFRCQYCHTQLRLGSYAFDKEGQYGHKFFCVHHYGMQGELRPTSKVTRKMSLKGKENKSPEKKLLSNISGVDLLDRVQTPERIEFSNLSTGNISSEHEEPPSQIDEDEWTDRNFGASTAEIGSSDDDSSELSDTDSDDEDAYEEALEEPITKEGTLKWAERLNRRYAKKRDDDSDSDDYTSSDKSSYYENSSGDDYSDTATEGEEEIRARELRKQEVRVEPPIVHTDTGTDTEVVSDETSSESSDEIQNSATEISTDSEFAQDDPTPTREIPSIVFNDFYVTKTRGTYATPKKLHVTSSFLQTPLGRTPKKQDIELKLEPLVPSTPITRFTPSSLPRTEGYSLNRTQSTGGIAAKVSLELKKKYLLGESSVGNGIQKSGSASTLDSKFKSFRTNISDCQRLLQPASQISASMKTFCNKLDERLSPILSPTSPLDTANREIKTEPPQSNAIIHVATSSDHKSGIENKELSSPAEGLQPITSEHESEGSRSPACETSIIVPNIDWNRNKANSDYNDSLLSSTDSDSIEREEADKHHFRSIPRVEVHNSDGEIVEEIVDNETLDSLSIPKENTVESQSLDMPKSVASEKKTLNQPKMLPNLGSEMMLPNEHMASHVASKSVEKSLIQENKSPEIVVKCSKSLSGRSTPSDNDSGEQITAALTETELSDWARDGNVSDDFEADEFEFSASTEKTRKLKDLKKNDVITKVDDIQSSSGMRNQSQDVNNKNTVCETFNNILIPNLDNIEFMDTGTETSSDDAMENANNGYVRFGEEEDLPEDSLSPKLNVTKDVNNHESNKNTGYCVLSNETDNFGAKCIDLKPADLEKLKQNHSVLENEEDSLLIIDPGTTTEENTCSDSTVKNITEKVQSNNNTESEVKDREQIVLNGEGLNEETDPSNIEYKQHCQRLQSKVEFSNAKDSIDIRKSRRKSKSESPPKPDLIQEEKEKSVHSDVTLQLSPAFHKTGTLYKKEEIEKERDLNQKLIQEMVMSKMKAQNKTLERKKRNRQIFSSNTTPTKPFELSKSATADLNVTTRLNSSYDTSNRNSAYSSTSSNYATPDVILPATLNALQKSHTTANVSDLNDSEAYSTPLASDTRNIHPVGAYSSYIKRDDSQKVNVVDSCSIPNIDIKAMCDNEFQTPIAPPRYKHEEAKRTAEKMKQNARARVRLLSNEELGLSPEDKLKQLREKILKHEFSKEDLTSQLQNIEVVNAERPNTLLYANDTLSKKRNGSFKQKKIIDVVPTVEKKLEVLEQKFIKPVRTKSVSELSRKNDMKLFRVCNQDVSKNTQLHKSDPNLLSESKKQRKNGKDDGRKSISRIFSTLFTKKKDQGDGGTSRGFLSRISPKAKEKSKEAVVVQPIRRLSLTESNLQPLLIQDSSPPPVPPLPTNYSVNVGQGDSSDGERESNIENQSSCDTLDQSGILDGSLSSLTTRRSKGMKKALRQAQIKRHRLAQEIQRKLEEAEVKTRELEERGVVVEKALRGEATNTPFRDESELLQEWFDLMRDRTDLRRYERELLVRAQELELEDRHARLQQELRERLANDEEKTKESREIAQKILNEMMEIVAKRDALVALLDEDRLRYSEEDRDFEEKMLAKGLNLTPIKKTSESLNK